MEDMSKIEILISKEEIQKKVHELGAKITKEYKGKKLHLVGVLHGSFIFLSDLIRSIDLDLTMDFISASSYGDDKVSSGVIKITGELKYPVKDRHVLLVDDILDTGQTMAYLKKYFMKAGALDVEMAVLLNKPSGRKVDILVDHFLFEIPDYFVVGYGLDYQGHYRQLDFIGKVCS